MNSDLIFFLGSFLRFIIAPDLQQKLIALHAISSHNNTFPFLYSDLSSQNSDRQASDCMQCRYLIHSNVYSPEEGLLVFELLNGNDYM